MCRVEPMMAFEVHPECKSFVMETTSFERGIRDKEKMQEKRRSTGRNDSQVRGIRPRASWPKVLSRRVFAVAACFSISLALSAYGGSSDNDAGPVSKAADQPRPALHDYA